MSGTIIDRFTKSDDTVKSLQDLQKRLRQKEPINLQKKIEGETIGEALLNFAVEDKKLNVVKFLFDNRLKIIDVFSKKDRTYRIIKTKSGESILSYAISHSSIEVVELILNSIDEQQSNVGPESKLYDFCRISKEKGLYRAIHEDKIEIVKLILNSIDVQQSVVSTPNGNLTGENSNISNEINPPQANAKIPNDDAKDDFYVALGKDVLGAVVLAAFVTSAIILPSIYFAMAAVLTAIIIGVHVNNHTVPSYMEMQGNSVDKGIELSK